MAVYDDQNQEANQKDLQPQAYLNQWENDAVANSDDKHDSRFREKMSAISEIAREEAKEFAKTETESFVKSALLEKSPYKFGASYGDDKVGSLTKRLGKWILPRKRPLFATSIGFIIFAVISFGVFTVTQGPMQFIHFAKYLQETHFYVNHYFLNNRLGKAIVFAATQDNPQRRNLSYIGNQFADHYENRMRAAGITPEYDGQFRIRAMIIDPSTPEGNKAVQHMRTMGIEVDGFTPDSEGRIRIDIDRNDLGETSTRYRRQVISGMVDSLDMNGVSSAAAARLLKLRAAVDFHPLKNIVRSADEDANAYLKRVQEDIERRIKYGVNSSNGLRANSNTPTGDGVEEGAEAANDRVSGETGDVVETINEDGSNADRRASIRTKFTAGYGAAGVAAMVCAVQKIGDAAADLSYANVNLPLIRTGMMTVAMGSQVESGQDVNLEELGAMQQYFYNEETNTSWVDARSIQANMGNEATGPDIPDSARPMSADTAKPAFFQEVDSTIDSIPGAGGFCDAVTTTFGGWALTAIGIGLTATGPIGAAINLGSEVLQEALVATFIDDVIAWIANDQIDLDVTGATFGAYADYGSVLAANDSAISFGGTELSDAEYAELKNEQATMAAIQRDQASVFTRYFDTSNYHSFASTALMQYAYPINTSSAASIVTGPVSIVGKLTKNFSSMFMPKSNADNHFDYGLSRYGFTLSEIDDQDFENPYENEKKVEEYGIARLNEKYGGACFNTIINPETYALETINSNVDDKKQPMPGAAKRYDQIDEKCNDRTNEELTRYRFYIADTVAIVTAACYEGITVEGRDFCREVGLTNTPIGGTIGTGVVEIGPPGETKPLGDGWTLQDNTSYLGTPCAPGSTETRTYTHPTKRFQIRLCKVGEIEVASVISENLINLLNQASSDGIRLTGYGFRSYEQQQELRSTNGCPRDPTAKSTLCRVPTAPPGESQHEQGLAIDFRYNGQTICYRGSAATCARTNNAGFKWLVANASKYGLYNWEVEAWHWSTSGN